MLKNYIGTRVFQGGPEHEDFSDRKRFNDYFVYDFDMAELKTLRRRQVRIIRPCYIRTLSLSQ